MVQTKTSNSVTLNKQPLPLVSRKMSGVNFIYWLQGCFELGGAETMTAKQVKMIKEHLAITDSHKFCDWLDGFLSTHEEGVNKKDFKVLKTKLESFLMNVSKEDVSSILEKLTKNPDWQTPSYPFPQRDIFCKADLFPISDRIIC